MDIAKLLEALPVAAKSPLAAVSYVVVIGAWLAHYWLAGQPKRRTEAILKQFGDDGNRLKALKEAFRDNPPVGLTGNEAILGWYRTRSSEKSRSLALVAWVATLIAVLLFLTAVYTKAQPARVTAVTFHDVGTLDCAWLPPGSQISVESGGRQIATTIPLKGCNAEFPVDAEQAGTATLRLSNAEHYELANAGTFDLAAPRWDAYVQTSGPARIRVSLFRYSQGTCPSQGDFDGFRSVLAIRTQSLREQFPADPRFDYLANLKVIDEDAAKPPESLNDFLAFWNTTRSLQLLTGMCVVRDGASWIESRVYLGPRDAGLSTSFIELESPSDVDHLRSDIDVHTATMLFALARDAASRGQDLALASQYISRALDSLAGQQNAAAKTLRDRIDATRKQFGIPDRMSL